MDHNEMIKRTKDDLRDFSSIVERLKECKTNLNYFQGQEELFSEDVQELNRIIRKCECKLKMIKVSLSVLCELDQRIITESYFSKITIKDIVIKLNICSKTIVIHKRKSIEKLANTMYGDLKDFDDISFLDIPKEDKRRGSRIYQYDLQGNFIKRWNSANECKSDGFNVNPIRCCCSGIYKQYKGYKWYYKPLELNK